MEDIETNEKEPTFVSQGSYGCIYEPGYTCKGMKESKRYVTKIQKTSKNTDKEIKMGEKIMEIKQYDLYFAPIYKSCDISLIKMIKNTDRNEIEKCEVITNSLKKKNKSIHLVFKANEIRYVLGKTLGDMYEEKINTFVYRNHFSEKDHKKYHNITHPFEYVIDYHMYLLLSLSKLKKKKLIHYDLKTNNILFDIQLNVPIIIDFGLTIEVNEINLNTDDLLLLKSTFYNDEQYLAWCPEIMLLSKLFLSIESFPFIEGEKEIESQKSDWKKQIPDVDMFYASLETYFKETEIFNENFTYRLSKLISKDSPLQTVIKNIEKDTRKKWEDYVKNELQNQNAFSIFQKLWKNKYTWDTYSLSTMYLSMLTIFPPIPINSKWYPIMEKYIQLQIENINSIPIERKTPLEMLKSMKQILNEKIAA
jgi:tRNA A-37 threonylcarbamoyl transferase component Bud32